MKKFLYTVLLHLGLVGLQNQAFATHQLRLLSLNLHGYHPTDEAVRYRESRDGKLEKAPSHIFYFREDELHRGHALRLVKLASEIERLRPHLVFLQEVAAGEPGGAKNCEAFHNDGGFEPNARNAALRLQERLSALDFQVSLACRGNMGWFTNNETFKDFRIVKRDAQGQRVVFDFNANPYPSGVLVEGMAILARPPFKVVENLAERLPIHSHGESTFVQIALIEVANSRTYLLAANVHGGHKLAHFEGAVAIRARLSQLLAEHPLAPQVRGIIVGGDFNSLIYRHTAKLRDPSSVAWEVTVRNEFDFAEVDSNADARAALASLLTELNDNPKYKPWAKVSPDNIANARIDAAISRFVQWLQRPAPHPFDTTPLSNTLESAVFAGACKPPSWGHGACKEDEGIDHIFTTPSLRPNNAYLLYTHHDAYRLDSLTDHPGIVADFEL